MSKLFDTETLKPIKIEDQEQLHDQILSGRASYKKGTRVNVYPPDAKGPLDAKSVPAEKVADAIKEGFSVETPFKKEVRTYIKENDNLAGGLKVGLGQFADELAFGIPELVFDKTQDPLEVAKKEALKKHHDLWNTVGGVGGFGAGLVVGSPFFKAATKAGEKTAGLVARGLANKAAGEVSESAAKRIAKDIVSRGTGAGVEGAILSSPYAFTEAALGDPDQAAETLLYGVGIGGLFGAGGVMAGRLKNKAQDAAKSLGQRLEGQDSLIKNVARKAAKAMSGVPEESIEKYIRNPERINAARSLDDIKDILDNKVAELKTAVDTTKDDLLRMKLELDDAYKGVRADIQTARAPKEVADELLAALEAEKAKLGQRGMDALEVLENSTKSIKTNKIKAIIGQYKSGLKIKTPDAPQGVFMPEVRGTVSMLDDMVASLNELGGSIPLPAAKTYLKQLDESLAGAYGGPAGAFDATADKLRKKIRKKISDEIKDLSPEYKAIMDEMAPRAQMLDEMSRAFGTPQKAVSKINKALKIGGEIEGELLAKFSAVQGDDWFGKLKKYSQEVDYQNRIRRGEDLRRELLPELSKRLDDAQMRHDQAFKRYEPAKRLTQQRTQSVIRNQGFKNASIEDRKALEYLQDVYGEQYLQMIDDRNVLNDFYKEYTNGSRRTLMGAVFGDLGQAAIGAGVGAGAGGLVAGPVGAAVGAAIGASADVYGGVALKRIIDGYTRGGGLLFTEQAMKNTALKLDKIPGLIKSYGEAQKRLPAKGTMGMEAVRRMLGKPESKEKDELSRDNRAENIKELTDKLAALATNPAFMTSKVDELAGFIADEGAPQVGAKYGEKLAAAVTYLLAAAPKEPAPSNPFAPKIKWRPSDYDMSQFEQKVAIALEPMQVFDELQQGTLTSAHMDSLKALYPKIYTQMVTRIQEYAVENPTEMPYDKRLKLSTILGFPIDDSVKPESVRYLQQTWQETGGEGADADDGIKAQVNIAEQEMTPEQARASRG